MEPPAKLFRKLSKRVLDKQLFLVKGIDTVIGFSHLGFQECFSKAGFQE